jgi:hypothetical protein
VKKSKELKSTEQLKNLYINYDLTIAERDISVLPKFQILKFASFNTRNSLTNIDFINFFFSINLDILFISETWLLNSESHYLKNLSNDYNFLHKSDIIFKPSRGRHFGGNCIFCKKLK